MSKAPERRPVREIDEYLPVSPGCPHALRDIFTRLDVVKKTHTCKCGEVVSEEHYKRLHEQHITDLYARMGVSDNEASPCQSCHCRERTVNGLCHDCTAHLLEIEQGEVHVLEKTNQELQAKLEVERQRLVACGVVAGANTRASASEARQMNDEYRSASLDDVIRAIDREIDLRDKLDRARQVIAVARQVNMLAPETVYALIAKVSEYQEES